GPPADAIEAMGSKTRAREIMRDAGVPIVPGTTEPVDTVEDAARIIDESIGYPVAIKAAGGGGGKGFRVALEADELEKAFEGAAREGEKFFSDPTVYIERYLPDPRHVEVQVLADQHGNVIHLGERDCSVQRRHQKLIEESPAPAVDDELRARIGEIGTEAARAVGYRSAGTVEGLLQDGEYFFLEMNTRVQVEHCVTEMVTGIDIVREQIRIAAGEKLSVAQKDVDLDGHAIECRINAEPADAEEEEEQVERSYAVEVSGRRFDVKVIGAAPLAIAPNGSAPAAGARKPPKRRERSGGAAGGAPGMLVSPIQGTVLKVAVQKGTKVDEGALICVIEAMKMENEITAPAAGTVEELNVSEGGSVATG